jgi:hypothetical protein
METQSNRAQVEALFPLKAYVTQEIIDNSNIYDYHNCIGANTLIDALGENIPLLGIRDVTWGSSFGTLYPEDCIDDNDETIRLTIKGGVDMMKVRKPMWVTFMLGQDD